MERGNCPFAEFAVWNVCNIPIIFDELYHYDLLQQYDQGAIYLVSFK